MAGFQNMANLLSGSSAAANQLAQYNIARQAQRNVQSVGLGESIMDIFLSNTPAVAGLGGTTTDSADVDTIKKSILS